MSHERFNHEKHLPMVTKWGIGRGMAVQDAEVDGSLYPTTGFVVNGIVASWIYMTNSTLAYIDSSISDPTTTKEARWEAMNEMLPLLVEEAKSLGAKVLCGYSFHKSFDRVLNEGGFETLPDQYNVYLRRL